MMTNIILIILLLCCLVISEKNKEKAETFEINLTNTDFSNGDPIECTFTRLGYSIDDIWSIPTTPAGSAENVIWEFEYRETK